MQLLKLSIARPKRGLCRMASGDMICSKEKDREANDVNLLRVPKVFTPYPIHFGYHRTPLFDPSMLYLVSVCSPPYYGSHPHHESS